MSRPLRIPHPQTPLHLYRHLLREASYLPPLARPFVDRQIKDRFRRHREDEGERTKKHLRDAHHDLRVLRAANAGDMVRMRRVLLLAFGRVGRRRRELMAHLLRPKPNSSAELEHYAAKAAAATAEGRKMDWLDRWDLDKLRAFARSQVQALLNNPPKAPITANQTVPAKCIPAENAWGKPLPPKLYRTKLKKMWKAVADKLMPPLPKREWELLADISEGKVRDPRWFPPPRRPVARAASGDGMERREWNWPAYATMPVSIVDRPTNRRNKLLTGAVDENTPTGDPQPINCHKYTARTWRRLFGNIWQLTATMEKKATGQGWNIVWGKPKFQAPPASVGDMEFFGDFAADAAPQTTKGKRREAKA